MRAQNRAAQQLRDIQIQRHFSAHAEGSALITCGHTRVLCTVSVEAGVPRWLKGKGQGWITAEYGMLPRSTHTRNPREAVRGKQSGRTLEIQRLIGRSLRAAVDLHKLGEYTLTVDCDVLQADGGTRTAAITGSCVALVDALRTLQYQKKLQQDPLKYLISAVSVGLVDGQILLDLDYREDSQADTDMNLVMTAEGALIEVQGTAEGQTYTRDQLMHLVDLGAQGCQQLIEIQQAALAQ